ncbi:MAG: response regulator [Myxococcota bacterium]|nr:response regulator [Myxococcota bacterium]
MTTQTRPARSSDVRSLIEADRVIVVEDDADARELTIVWLEHHGFVVTGASGEGEALALLLARPHDVAVIDLHLGAGPVGVDLARRLRTTEATRRMALVAVSARVDPDWSVVEPFDAYLRKPLDFDLLADLVRQLASANRARDATARTGTVETI